MKTPPARARQTSVLPTSIAALIVCAAHATAQTSISWADAYAPASTDSVAGVVRDAQGRIFVAGKSQGFSTPSTYLHEGFVRAYDSTGATLWTRTMGGVGKMSSGTTSPSVRTAASPSLEP